MPASEMTQALAVRWPRRKACQATMMLGVIATALFALRAHAMQVIEARDGVSVEAIVSMKEATRIRIENAPITDVFGNIFSSNCSSAAPSANTPVNGLSPTSGPVSGPSGVAPPTNPAGEVVLECDRDKGEIYIRPVGESSKPINLFVSSASATYILLLHRSDTPADTIVIRDTSQPERRSAAAAGPSPNHVRTMKALLVAMATGEAPPDVRVEDSRHDVQLWKEAHLTLTRRYSGRGLIGEKYLLQNISSAPMVLAEQEFDRDTPNSEVEGVAIEHHNLLPGQSTNVYVIRRGGAQ